MAGDGGLGHHLEFQEIGEQDGLVAFTAPPAEAQGTAKHVAGLAATFSNQTFATLATLVQRVSHQCAALSQFGPTAHHRRSFAPVHNILYGANLEDSTLTL